MFLQTSESWKPESTTMGLSSEWVRRWLLKLQFWVKHNPHKSHLKGFSPVWMRICVFKFNFQAKHNPQVSHSNGFSTVWVCRWLFKCPIEIKHSPQKSHLMFFCQNVSTYVTSNFLYVKTVIRMCHIWMVSPRYECADNLSNFHSE